MNNSRLAYLDGLRGLLAAIVFVHHFFYLFYPQFIFGGPPADFAHNQYTAGKCIALTPLNIFFNPAMAVQFFFLLSGYVQTHSYFVTNEALILKRALVKRYLRLALPVLAVVLLVFGFHKLNLIHKEAIPQNTISTAWKNSMLPDNLHFLKAVQHGLFSNFISASKYYQVLWTMPIELINSYLILMVLLLTHPIKHKVWLFLPLLLVQLYFGNSFFAPALGIGALIAYCEQSFPGFRRFFAARYVKTTCCLAGLYIASYPFTAYSGVLLNTVYKPLAFLEVGRLNPSYFIGTLLLFCWLLNSVFMQQHLSRRPFVILGKISFMLYLVHLLVLLSFSALTFQWLSALFPSVWALILNFFISAVLVIIVSQLLCSIVDRPALAIGNCLARKFIKDSE